MKPKVYLETSVISYLTAKPSRDLVTAARQELTRQWWDVRNDYFEPFVSSLVVEEASLGDPVAAVARLEICHPLKKLPIDEACLKLADQLIKCGAIPKKENEDAVHIALATLSKMDAIATWNFAHLVGPFTKVRLQKAIESFGFKAPVLTTPEEMLEELK